MQFDSILHKSVSKSNLVQVMRTVTKNGKTFQQHFWISPSDVKSTDVVIGGNTNNDNTNNKQDNVPTNPKQMLVQLIQNSSKQDLIKQAKKLGIQVNESSHEGINWMRCSMAIQKDISANPSNWGFAGTSDTKTTDNTSDNKSVESKTDTDTGAKKQSKNADSDSKQKVAELRDKYGRDKLMEMAKSAGVKWTENGKEGINWMRCSMALNKALSENPNLLDEHGTVGIDDLAASVKSKSKSKTPAKKRDTSDPLLKGISTDSMSAYEDSTFGSILDNASPENLRNYRTLGMCAGDSEAEQYLGRLYKDYSTTLQSMNGTGIPKYDPNIDSDSLRNSLQGVVNKMIVGTVKSTMSNVRKRTHQFTLQQKLFEPWVNPNHSLSKEEKDKLKSMPSSNMGTARCGMMQEQDGNHEMMKRVLDRMSLTPEYGDLAKEYKALLNEFDNLTDGNPTLQTAVTQPTNSSSILSSLHYSMMHDAQARDKYKADIDKYIASGTAVPTYLQSNYDRFVALADESERLYNKFSTPAELDNLVNASNLKAKLFDKKFDDVNANLWGFKQIANQIAYQYETNRDFVAEYPILSKSDIDKVNSGDQTALTNLSLYAGMFKPSLSKGGSDAKSALMQKFKERQDFLDTYGGVSSISGNAGYAENNEVKCKVSSVSQKVYDQISRNIASDWDKKNHGRMKYKIKGIYEVSGLQAESDFNAIKNSHKGKQNKSMSVTGHTKNQTSDLFYHGTGAMATSLILGHSGGFKVGKAKVGRMLGDGIYLADKSSKSAQYISDSGYSRAGIHGSLMVVEASLGSVTGRNDRRNWDGYDTVFAGTSNDHVLNNEWCVHNPKAIIPRYLVEMEVL